ncbi:MAG: IS3 family transposase [Actinobacteria bacterium]|nr:IS3 family transposase [Actinomycetota bacterium]
MKRECLQGRVFATRADARRAIFRWINWYNTSRLHSTSGDPIPVSGGAVLTVAVRAPAYDIDTGQPTVPWRVGTHIVSPAQFSSGGFRTFRDLVAGVSFEGVSDFGLGVRARLPFRVFTLTGPGGGSRVVIDVAHQW